MAKIYLAFILLFAAAHSAAPKILFKEGQVLAGFSLERGNLPCKKNSPCLFFHKDSDKLRLILNGKNIRMAYKGEDKNNKVPFPKNFKFLESQEKASITKDYRDFFRSEFAFMLQAFVYTSPEIFDWDVENFKAEQNKYLISEQELSEIFETGEVPEYYTIFKIKCAGGETAVFESDAKGNFYMEIE